MYVLTIDQRGSTRRGVRVDGVLDLLREVTRDRDGVVLPFEQTVGDEVQGVLRDPALVVDVVLALLRDRGWSVGVGAGAVDRPLPAESRLASGEAFVRARRAVDRAKARPAGTSLAVVGPEPAAGEAEALLRLLGAVAARRTSSGWEVVDTLAGLGQRDGRVTQKEAAAALAISEQAVSQRVRTALWQEEAAVRPLAVRLVADLRQDDPRQDHPQQEDHE